VALKELEAVVPLGWVGMSVPLSRWLDRGSRGSWCQDARFGQDSVTNMGGQAAFREALNKPGCARVARRWSIPGASTESRQNTSFCRDFSLVTCRGVVARSGDGWGLGFGVRSSRVLAMRQLQISALEWSPGSQVISVEMGPSAFGGNSRRHTALRDEERVT
jgi:hypothetical protein